MNEINTHQLEKEQMSGGRASPDTGTPSRLIKEKLLKEIEEEQRILENEVDQKKISQKKYVRQSLLFSRILTSLIKHKETSKAKDEEFIKILDELLPKFYEDGAEVYAEEIKQRIKEEWQN